MRCSATAWPRSPAPTTRSGAMVKRERRWRRSRARPWRPTAQARGRGRAAGGGGRPGGAALVRGGGGARDGVPRACDQRRQARGAVGPRRAGAAVLGRCGGGCGRRPLARGAVGGGRRAVRSRNRRLGAASARGCWNAGWRRRSAAPFRSTSPPPACAAASAFRPTTMAMRAASSPRHPALPRAIPQERVPPSAGRGRGVAGHPRPRRRHRGAMRRLRPDPSATGNEPGRACAIILRGDGGRARE